MAETLKHLCLVDGSGFIFRAFHGLPPMTRPDGTPVNAVFGFTNMLMKLMPESKADHLAVIFDAGRATRSATRSIPNTRRTGPIRRRNWCRNLRWSARPRARSACRRSSSRAYEADDLIATYARLAVAKGARVTIVSSDKDLMQLVGDGVGMLDPLKNREIGPDQVREKFGVGPERVIDVQALAGDPTDNVPGVPGIGVKTAAQLIDEYGDLDTLLARAGEIKQPKRRETLLANADAARISRDLVRLKNDVPVPEPLESFGLREPDHAVLLAFLDAQGFRSIRARVVNEAAIAKLNGGVAAPPAASPSVALIPSAAPIAKEQLPAKSEAAKPIPAIDGPAHYELILSAEDLARWVAEATAAGMVCVDTETDSLDPLRANLVGVSLSIVPGRACYIPVRHDPAPKQGALDLAGAASGKDAPKLIPAATIAGIAQAAA